MKQNFLTQQFFCTMKNDALTILVTLILYCKNFDQALFTSFELYTEKVRDSLNWNFLTSVLKDIFFENV